jgi:homoserine O-acetyltransferase
MSAHEVFELADFTLQRGVVLPKAQLAYKTFGELNSRRTNAILYPTSYGATHADLEWLIGPERILDPSCYFIILVNQFGNGVSSSPSNLPEPWGGKYLDLFTHVDNVRAQQQMLQAVYGIEKLALVYGWSMGAQQALHWGSLYPERVERIAAICGSAQTSPHNIVFLEGIRAALTCDEHFTNEGFTAKPMRGLRAMARVYAGWAMSQAFYRERVYLRLGYQSLEDYLIRDWEASFLKRDAGNLVSMIETWKRSDISANDTFRGDLESALAAITARTLIMPCDHDLYFTAEDSQREARQIKNSIYKPIHSVWGHRAGNPVKSPADEHFIAAAIRELLQS